MVSKALNILSTRGVTSCPRLAILPSPLRALTHFEVNGFNETMNRPAHNPYSSISKVLFIGVVVAFFNLSEALAEGGEHHGSISDLKWFWLNFLVYVTLLVVLLRKPVKAGWASRRAKIADAVSSATSEMAQAERELAAVEALTKNLTAEQQRARGEILSQGELEVQAIGQAATEKSARIRSQVKELLEGETRSAEVQFKSNLIARAVELSKERFKSGEYAGRQAAYVEAAADRAKRLVR